MRFTPSLLDEIRARLPVSAVVGRRVKLKKQGREWRGLSPFNAEKTPSFYVNDQKGFYHDFSSGKHGDQFTFLMETEGLSFPEAVERLAEEAGVPLPAVDPDAMKREEARRSLVDVMDLATAYFQATLQGRTGAHARGYLARRELSAETWAEFRIGYATSERFGLRDHLSAKGVSREDMIATGLLVHGEDIEVPYDRFRDRVLFPIQDMRGRVVAFGGRALSADVPAKYLNSPETELFRKGSMLFNGHRARKAAHDTNRLVVVEGYVDVVALAQAGIVEAVAPLGTAMTEDQFDLAWRMVPEPILCFDGDKAGLRAAHRAIDIALPKIGAEKTIRFAFLPSGMDPDDLVRQRGRAAMEEVLSASRSLVDVLWERETGQADISTPERRAGLERRLREVTGAIADQTLKRYYEEDVRARLKALFGVRNQTADSPRSSGGKRSFPARMRGREGSLPIESAAISRILKEQQTQSRQRDEAILLLFINSQDVRDSRFDVFEGLTFFDSAAEKLRRAIVRAIILTNENHRDSIFGALKKDDHQNIMERFEKKMIDHPFYRVIDGRSRFSALQQFDEMVEIRRRHIELTRDLETLSSAYLESPTDENRSRLTRTKAELDSLVGDLKRLDPNERGEAGGGQIVDFFSLAGLEHRRP